MRRYLETKAYGGHCIENSSPGSRTVNDNNDGLTTSKEK